MSLSAGIILGVLVGWILEWVIDWLYWRKRMQAQPAVQAGMGPQIVELPDQPIEITALQAENETLKNRLERYAAVGDGLLIENNELKNMLETCKKESTRLASENARLKSQLETLNRAPDDLKLIKGIGPEIERLLHQAGILSFAQLADLTAADLERILGSTIKRLADEQELLNQARKLANQNN